MRVALLALPAALAAAAAPLAAQAHDASHGVAGGGISVAGWAGAVDASEARNGLALKDARFALEGSAIRITSGPATTFWNTKTALKGDYTVKATFTEPKFVGDHPHPYGIVVAASPLEAGKGQALYCAAYGNGTFIFRGFSPAPFQVSERRPTAHPAIRKASGPGASVTQEIAVSVQGDKVTCRINGAEVGSYPRSAVVGAGKVATTDGFAGVRVGHNADVIVTGFTAGK